MLFAAVVPKCVLLTKCLVLLTIIYQRVKRYRHRYIVYRYICINTLYIDIFVAIDFNDSI